MITTYDALLSLNMMVNPTLENQRRVAHLRARIEATVDWLWASCERDGLPDDIIREVIWQAKLEMVAGRFPLLPEE